MPLVTGDPAPDFALPDENGDTVRLSDYFREKGRRAILIPPTTPPGARRRRASSRSTMGTSPMPAPRCWASPPTAPTSIGSSGRSTASRCSAERSRAHRDGELRCLGRETLYGRKSVGVIRSTMIIGADGLIERAWYHVRADGHAEKVLAALRG